MSSLFNRSLAATALGCALTLVACGGGGGSGGAPAGTKSLTLAGIVTDGPISGALVTVRIGSQTFTAVAGSDGRYRVPISIPADAGANLVVIEARGPASGPNSNVSLISLTRSFDSLLAVAGSDKELNASEAPSVNVTHLSTANAVLVIELNGSTPSSDAALQQAESQVDPKEVLELAAAIKLIVDSPTEYSLPSGNTNTLQFAQNESARETFIETAKQDNPEDFEQAQEQTVSDPNVAPPPTAGGMPASLTYVASVATQNSFNFTGQANIFNFASGGRGSHISRYGRVPMQWEIVQNTTTVRLDQALTGAPYPGDFGFDEVKQDYFDCTNTDSYDRIEIVRLSERSARIGLNGNSHQVCRYLNEGSEFERDVAIEDFDFQTLVSNDNFLAAPDLSTAKSFAQYTLNLAQESQYVERLAADVLSFNPGGSGSSRFFAGNFTWQKSSDGKTLTVAFANGIVSTYQALRKVDDQAAVVLATVTKPNGQTYADLNLRFAAKALEPLTPELVPGAYYQFGVGEENPEFDPYGLLKGFWLEFYGDGTGRQVSDFYEYDANGEPIRDDKGQPIVSDSRGFDSPRFFWSSTADSITNTRTYNSSPGPDETPFSSCPEGASDCVVWDRREIFPVNFVERPGTDRIYVLERRQLAADRRVGITDETRTAYLLRYYDIDALPVAAKSASKANGSSRQPARDDAGTGRPRGAPAK